MHPLATLMMAVAMQLPAPAPTAPLAATIGTGQDWVALAGAPTPQLHAGEPRQVRLGAAIDSLAAAAVRSGAVTGLSVAVLRGGETVRIQGYGMADLEHAVPATDSTRYYVGSITKTMTAAAILRLAEQGRLDLDDDVTRYIPELDSPGPPIRLSHLLSHTSGLAGPAQVAHRFLERRHLDFTREQLLELVQGEARVSAPGERWAYNNLGYLLLGMVAERVAEMPYEELLRDGVLAPAAAHSVALCDARRIIPHRATGYVMDNGSPVHHEPVNASLLFAAGGLCANAGDIAAWLRALARGAVIAPASVEAMTTPQRLTDDSAVPYGYGIFVDSAHGTARIQHGGDANGFSAHAAHYPEHDLTIVVLTNTRSSVARDLANRIGSHALAPPGLPDS
jgi:D-alanyl-D-alanine carboxypeptidase